MTRAATQDERFDHAQDHRKNHIPELPLHAQTAPLSTAMDIVVLVKAMTNYVEAAKLIEQYAAMIAADARIDEFQKVSNKILERFEVPNV